MLPFKYPYTNFHEINLDWILKTVKSNTDRIAENESKIKLLGGDDPLNSLHPIGSIFISAESTSPASKFGGTWEQLKGRFLIGAGQPESNNTDAWGSISTEGINMTSGEMGGTFNHNHGLESGHAKISNIDGQSKNFGFSRIENVDMYQPNIVADLQNIGLASSSNITANNLGTKLGGTTDFINLLPPYIVVYMWKRVS